MKNGNPLYDPATAFPAGFPQQGHGYGRLPLPHQPGTVAQRDPFLGPPRSIPVAPLLFLALRGTTPQKPD